MKAFPLIYVTEHHCGQPGCPFFTILSIPLHLFDIDELILFIHNIENLKEVVINTELIETGCIKSDFMKVSTNLTLKDAKEYADSINLQILN